VQKRGLARKVKRGRISLQTELETIPKGGDPWVETVRGKKTPTGEYARIFPEAAGKGESPRGSFERVREKKKTAARRNPDKARRYVRKFGKLKRPEKGK